nr:TusE/DsrC/DsvC family sulfur relay protein [candidate division Zixibacteria bacterium]
MSLSKRENMGIFAFKGKSYAVDDDGFLLNFREWDENFSEGMASISEISRDLTKEHWDVIYFIRNTYENLGKCPQIYLTCTAKNLHLKDLKELFPAGYLRGACKLAGITYKEGYIANSWTEIEAGAINLEAPEKTYRVDVRGFLVNPYDWDEQYAIHKAYEMKMPEELNQRHWQIIRYLREQYKKNRGVPTVYETCRDNQIELNELEVLFPDGYHRGAVKISGLRVR